MKKLFWTLAQTQVEVIGESKEYPDCLECMHNGEKIAILKTELTDTDY